MELIADILLGAGALGVAAYCHVLARRLAAFSRLEGGIGGAVAVLSAQVDDMTTALVEARAAARLDLILATMHDLPEDGKAPAVRRRVLRRRSSSPEIEEEAA